MIDIPSQHNLRAATREEEAAACKAYLAYLTGMPKEPSHVDSYVNREACAARFRADGILVSSDDWVDWHMIVA